MKNKEVIKQYCQHCSAFNSDERPFVLISGPDLKLCPKCGEIIRPCTYCIEHKLKEDEDTPCSRRCSAPVNGLSKEEGEIYIAKCKKREKEHRDRLLACIRNINNKTEKTDYKYKRK